MDEAKIKEAYMEMQVYEQQMKAMQQQLEAVDTQMQEIMAVKESLSQLKNVKPQSPIKVPLTNGIFIEGKITDTNALYVNVGANVVVKKDIAGATSMMDEQLHEITQVRAQMIMQLQQMQMLFKTHKKELKKMME
ncbi:prefoldin subunit alpha [Candidatus Woesearchaeota archaeon]|nr:prefoldin subunit alpha [Candidatus Woesearchaeota archaeon]